MRAELMAFLEARGVGSLIHYPVPIPDQGFLSAAPPSSCPIADRVCTEVCSLPLYPQLGEDDVDFISDAVRGWGDGRH